MISFEKHIGLSATYCAMLLNPGFLLTSCLLLSLNLFSAVPYCLYLYKAGLVHSMSWLSYVVDYNQVTSSVLKVLVYFVVGIESGIYLQRSCGLAEDRLANLDLEKI
jgi:hypothetical protein